MRSFLGFGQSPYIGQPYSRPIKLGGIAGAVVPLLFQWISYGVSTFIPKMNVLVDIDTKSCSQIDQIRSVYIDNLGCDQPVYVYFPDTFYTVVAKPNSEGWYPALTNARQVWVIGEGFLTGDVGQTAVLLSNLPFIPSVNVEIEQAVQLYKASPLITRGTSIYNSNFGVPALGDQTMSYLPTFNAPAVGVHNMWGTPYNSGFVYLTHINLKLVGIVTGASSAAFSFVIESTGASGTLYNFGQNYGPNLNETSDLFISLSGMNIKLNAQETWQTRCYTYGLTTPGGAALNMQFNFTVSD